MAKHLGISPRELREKVIAKVKFGVKTTDREMPMAIASGIVRYASRVLKISCPPLEYLFDEDTENNEEKPPEITGEEVRQPVQKIVKAVPLKRSKLTTLERLRGIGNSSQGDTERLIAKTKLDLIKKEEEKKKKEEELQKKRLEAKKSPQKKRLFPKNNHRGGPSRSGPSIMRKIEISKEDAEEARRKQEERALVKQKRKEEEEQAMLERKLLRKKRSEEIFTKKTGTVELPSELSVKEFAEKIGVPISMVITSLVKNGILATVTQQIDFDTASIIAEELEVTVKQAEESISSEDLLKGDLSKLLEDDESKLTTRPPIIAVVGHVDHGKTSILDAIRNTKVTQSESGGITQHIGAYSIIKNKKAITFLDTPGHAAFTSMRSRGAKTADIVILVVAADDGVKPQTIEAINHAKEAGVQIIVAANKIDKESANLDKLKGELAEYGIQVEDWGGDIPMVPVSALQGTGIDELLEMVFLQADIMELKANPKRLAVGTVIESHLDAGLGPVATILVNTGTMKLRDRFILGSTWGKVKSIVNEDGKSQKKVLPSGAARISGMADLPEPGDIFQVLATEKELKLKKKELEELKHSEKKNAKGMVDIIKHINTRNLKTLNLVVKADTIGSLESIEQSLKSIGNSEVATKIIHSAAGAITESDIMMASAGNGYVISFHTNTPNVVKQFAEKEKVEIKSYEIIYDLIGEITDILEGMLEPDIIETITGVLDVKGVFFTKGKRKIVGGKVSKGYFEHPSVLRVLRKGEILGEAKLTGIQHFEEKVRRIESPKECGLNLEGFMEDLIEGDSIEGVISETVIRKMIDVEKKEKEEEKTRKLAAKKRAEEKEQQETED